MEFQGLKFQRNSASNRQNKGFYWKSTFPTLKSKFHGLSVVGGPCHGREIRIPVLGSPKFMYGGKIIDTNDFAYLQGKSQGTEGPNKFEKCPPASAGTKIYVSSQTIMKPSISQCFWNSSLWFVWERKKPTKRKTHEQNIYGIVTVFMCFHPRGMTPKKQINKITPPTQSRDNPTNLFMFMFSLSLTCMDSYQAIPAHGRETSFWVPKPLFKILSLCRRVPQRRRKRTLPPFKENLLETLLANPIRTRETISTTEIFPLWPVFLSAKRTSSLQQGGVLFIRGVLGSE